MKCHATLGLLALLMVLCGCPGAIDSHANTSPGAAGASDAGVNAATSGEPADCVQVKLGPRRLWRLTPTQYDNTLHDLFGITSQYGGGFPADAVVNGFSNNSDALVMTPLMADKMSSAARDVASKVDLTKFASCAGPQADDTCLHTLIGKLGAQVFRRPLTAADGDRYFTLGKLAGDFDSGARLVVTAMLQSPNFLYRFEIGQLAADASFKLNDYEVASELSYLLWQTMPDQALFDAASKQALHEKAQVAQQVDRMLKAPQARPVVRNFVFEWLGLSTIATVPKDPASFPDLSNDLRTALAGEAERFIDHVLFDENGSISTLLTEPTTFLDAQLASFYGVQLPASSDGSPQAVQLSGQERRGILTLGGTMLVHSRSNDSSPVLRGKLVRESFLCQPLPPPPVGIVVSPPPVDPTKTTRERYAAHSTVEPCATCHRLMDPIGLSFEHFDGIGRFRQNENGLPIDVSGQIIGSPHSDGNFVGTDQLIDKLDMTGDARDCYAQQWYQFAYGYSDDTNHCLSGRMQQAIDASDGSLTTIITLLTQADGFLAREGTQDSTPPSAAAPTLVAAADGGTAVADASATSATQDAGPGLQPNLDLTKTVDNDYGTGYCYTYEVHNRGTTPITWSVALDVTGTMNQHWECEASAMTGHVTFTGEDYNGTLQADAKAQFGYCAQR